MVGAGVPDSHPLACARFHRRTLNQEADSISRSLEGGGSSGPTRQGVPTWKWGTAEAAGGNSLYRQHAPMSALHVPSRSIHSYAIVPRTQAHVKSKFWEKPFAKVCSPLRCGGEADVAFEVLPQALGRPSLDVQGISSSWRWKRPDDSSRIPRIGRDRAGAGPVASSARPRGERGRGEGREEKGEERTARLCDGGAWRQ